MIFQKSLLNKYRTELFLSKDCHTDDWLIFYHTAFRNQKWKKCHRKTLAIIIWVNHFILLFKNLLVISLKAPYKLEHVPFKRSVSEKERKREKGRETEREMERGRSGVKEIVLIWVYNSLGNSCRIAILSQLKKWNRTADLRYADAVSVKFTNNIKILCCAANRGSFKRAYATKCNKQYNGLNNSKTKISKNDEIIAKTQLGYMKVLHRPTGASNKNGVSKKLQRRHYVQGRSIKVNPKRNSKKRRTSRNV